MKERRSLVTSTGAAAQIEVAPPEPLYIPQLPPEARLPANVDTSHTWLDMYIDWTHAKSPMTPIFFNEAAGLWLASVAVARRLVLPMAHGDVYPNLYVAWIAPTTLYAKTTSMDLARALANETFPHLLAAQDTTPEALLHDMAGIEPRGLGDLPQLDQDLWKKGCLFAGQRGLVLDEFSGLLATARKGYGAGLIEALIHFYDCDSLYRRSTIGGGWVVVRHSYLSLLGASTLGALHKDLLAEALWSRGWWPRFGLLCPEGRPPWRASVDVDRPASLAEQLRALYGVLPKPTGGKTLEALEVQLGRGVYDAWAPYSKALWYDLQTDALGRLAAYYGRLPTKALRIATLLAALEWAAETEREEGPTIQLRHWWRAQEIAESWRGSAHRLWAAITQSEVDTTAERVRGIVSRANSQGITLREIKRRMQDRSARDVERAVQDLVGKGALEPSPYKPPRGRSTVRYRIP